MGGRSGVASGREGEPQPPSAAAPAAPKSPSFFGTLKRWVRWPDWALSRIPMLCTVGSYLALVHGESSTESLRRFLVFTFVFATCSSAFGFLVNDLGDRELDRRHGKRNTFLELGTTKAAWLLASATVLMVLSGLPFIDRPNFALLWALLTSAAVAYSLPPFRLKARGAAGIAVSSMAQWTLPVLLAVAAFQSATAWELGVFLLAATISGATLELAHQRHDRPNDAATGTSTFAVELGRAKVDSLYRRALWADRIAVGVMLVFVVVKSHTELKVSGAAALSAAVIIVYVAALVNLSVRVAKGREIDPYYGRRTMTNRILHDMTPNLLIPALLLTQLALQAPIWSVALVVFLVWRVVLPRLN